MADKMTIIQFKGKLETLFENETDLQYIQGVNDCISLLQEHRAALEAGMREEITDETVAKWMDNELKDFADLISRAAVVYEHATGGAISNVLTLPESIIPEIDSHIQGLIDEAVADALEAGMRGTLRFRKYNENDCYMLLDNNGDYVMKKYFMPKSKRECVIFADLVKSNAVFVEGTDGE